MKAIVINAAPRMESGNTQMVLTPFLVGMRHGGAKIDMALLARKKMELCRGCFTCYSVTPGQCVHNDDMPALVERIRSADMMVLATPVYLDGMTSLAKAFIDRLVVFLDPRFTADDEGLVHPLRMRFPGKLFLVSVCGYPGLHNFDPLTLHMKRIARNLHSEFSGAILRPAVYSLLLTKKYPERTRGVMEAIRRAGEELAEDGKVSPSTFDEVSTDICSRQELMVTANAYWDRELEKSSDQPA